MDIEKMTKMVANELEGNRVLNLDTLIKAHLLIVDVLANYDHIALATYDDDLGVKVLESYRKAMSDSRRTIADLMALSKEVKKSMQ